MTTNTISGALRGHVEAEREAEDRDDDLVQRHHEHVDDVAKEKPDAEMREHQLGGLVPVCFFVRFGVRHRPHLLNGLPKGRAGGVNASSRAAKCLSPRSPAQRPRSRFSWSGEEPSTKASISLR